MPALFRTARPVPADRRATFFHLYLDTGWFGVLSASAMAFVSVYATRLGATAFQIGLFSAGPAIVNLLFTLPAGQWLEDHSLGKAVFGAAAFHRLFYLLWVPLPLVLAPEGQVWALIGLTLLMSIPGTFLAVGFNALFAASVPLDWRGHVVGVRNALLAITFIITSLLCGYILNRLPFPTGYQVVFMIGFLGAVMSTLHLWFVTPYSGQQHRPRTGRSLGDLAWPGRIRLLVDSLRPGAGLRYLVRRRSGELRSPVLFTGPFSKLMAVLFAFHFAVHLAVPLYPLQWVNQLQLTDMEIGLGTAVFYVSVFVASTQLERLSRRLGNQRVTAVGALFMGAYPLFIALSQGLPLFLVASVAGGLGWALVGGALLNYILEKVPEDHRPTYLAWYNLGLNAALLLGSLLGPFVAGLLGVPLALLLFSVLRLLSALLILRWE